MSLPTRIKGSQQLYNFKASNRVKINIIRVKKNEESTANNIPKERFAFYEPSTTSTQPPENTSL